MRDATFPEGTRVAVVLEPTEHGPLRSLSEEELRRRREACERLEAFATRIAKTAKPTPIKSFSFAMIASD